MHTKHTGKTNMTSLSQHTPHLPMTALFKQKYNQTHPIYTIIRIFARFYYHPKRHLTA